MHDGMVGGMPDSTSAGLVKQVFDVQCGGLMDSYRMDKSINGRKDGHVLRKIVRIRRNDGCRFRVVLFPELYFGCFFSRHGVSVPR